MTTGQFSASSMGSRKPSCTRTVHPKMAVNWQTGRLGQAMDGVGPCNVRPRKKNRARPCNCLKSRAASSRFLHAELRTPMRVSSGKFLYLAFFPHTWYVGAALF